MPIYEIICGDCGQEGELFVGKTGDVLPCPRCGSHNTSKLMSATSSRSGRGGQQLPGPGDTACCGNSPSQADCAGPGSCCGKKL
jgi:putative FmdB family regulatory protein